MKKLIRTRKTAFRSILGLACMAVIVFVFLLPKTQQNIAIASGANLSEWSEQLGAGEVFAACAGSPINGVCNVSAANSCTAGTLGVNSIQADGSYQWYCNGTDGGATSPLCSYTPPVWTNYCTGGSNANPANNWQKWAYDNSNPRNYRFVEPGTVANGCAAPVAPVVPVVPGSTVTGVCNNLGGYSCTAGNISSPSGDATVGWSWYCDGTPNDAAHRSPSCFYKPASGPSGTISASPNPCTIAIGGSTCSTTITWNASGTASATVYAGSTLMTGGLSGSDVAPWMNLNNSPLLFSLKDSGGSQLSSVTVNAVCAPNSTWDGVTCVAITGVTNGSCSAAHYSCTAGTSGNNVNGAATYSWDCLGTNGGSTASCTESKTGCVSNQGAACSSSANSCGLTNTGTISCTGACSATTPPQSSCGPTGGGVTWTNYCTGGNDVNGNNWQIWAYDNSAPRNYRYVTLGTVANGCVPGGGVSCPTPWGTTLAEGVTITAFNFPSVISPATCTGTGFSQTLTCTSGRLVSSTGGSTYTNPNCTVRHPVLNSFGATPTRVKSGGTTVVSWSATDVDNCSITRNGVAWQSGTSSSGTSDTVFGQTVYTITCDALPSQSVTVNIVPIYNEF